MIKHPVSAALGMLRPDKGIQLNDGFHPVEQSMSIGGSGGLVTTDPDLTYVLLRFDLK